MTAGGAWAQPERARALGRLLAATLLLWIPLRVMALGYLPPDDALRHAAKAVSGREWGDILVLRPEITEDQHPGWHAFLGAFHRLAGADAFDLVFVAVVTLFGLFFVLPLAWVSRAEAWLLSILALTVFDPGTIARMMLGRPLLISGVYVAVFALAWPRLDEPLPPRATLIALVVLTAAATWMHGSWYLLSLPLVATALARRFRVLVRLTAATVAGIIAGALLAPHPLRFLYQAVLHGYLALGSAEPTITVVTEFEPFDGKALVVAAVLALLAWRRGRRGGRPPLERDPAFVMLALGWVLGYVAVRFYADWAVPALLAFLTRELEDELGAEPGGSLLRQLALPAALGLTLVLAISSDAGGRWTLGNDRAYVIASKPEHAPWVPEPGGILYSPDMTFFYRTFFRNPNGPWRYILGFEPRLMPEPDLAVFREIRKSRGATDSYTPWLAKMRPQDRLWIRQSSNVPPPVPGLEWYQPVMATWCGRLPREAAPK